VRILILSNYYPPAAFGGQEQRCSEVALALAGRGHSVRVLTSRGDGLPRQESDSGVSVQRCLHLQAHPGFLQTGLRFFSRHRQVQGDLDCLRRILTEFSPDIVYIWGMWNVSRSVPWLAEQLCPGKVVYNISDYWLTLPEAYIQYWRAPSGRVMLRLVKYLLGRMVLTQMTSLPLPQLRLEHPICISRAIRDRLLQSGVSVEHARVIYGGIRAERFDANGSRQRNRVSGGDVKLLYAGRIVPEKGVRTAIVALSLIPNECRSLVTLDVVGDGEPSYQAQLQRLVHRHGLENHVTFHGRVAYQDIPMLFRQYDVFVFPSEWEEPFARSVLEAMAAGLPVIGTNTGGTGEVLVAGETGLVFPPGDASTLAHRIQFLVENPSIVRTLVTQAQQVVRERFTFQRMMDESEAYLLHVTSLTRGQ
jgi:glycogen synthase